MPALAESDDGLAALAERLGHIFGDAALLELAVRHRSWCAEHGNQESNERLEFLGDAVLGLVVTEELYVTGPGLPEGVLAQRRSELVNARVLTELARQTDLGPALLLGRGEEATGGRDKPSILADTMEAVLGAIYLDGGLEPARVAILSLLDDQLRLVADGPGTDFKSRLQEVVARRFEDLPEYEIHETGPDHDKWFEASVRVDQDLLGAGAGRSKKAAEQAAAAQAWRALGEGSEFADPTDGASENGAENA